MCPRSISTLKPLRAIFSLPFLCRRSALGSRWLCYRSLPLTCSSFFSFCRTLPLLDRTLILCDVKLISLLPYITVSLKMITVDDSLGGLWCVFICVGVSMMACGETGERWGTGRRWRRRCVIPYQHCLATGCVTLVSSLAQFGTQYLQRGIIRRAPVSFCGVTEGTGTLNYMSHFWICSFFDI